MEKEKVHLLDINIFASGIFILTIIVSTVLTYNDKLILLGEKPIFNKKESKNIRIINRFVLLIIAILYLYTTYQDYKINQFEKKENATKSSFINLIISEVQLLTVIVVSLLPLIYPEEEQEEEILIP